MNWRADQKPLHVAAQRVGCFFKMDRSPQTRVILFLLHNLAQKEPPATLDAIRTHPLWIQQRQDDAALTRLLAQMVSAGLILCETDAYSLTKQGAARVKQFMSEGFSAIMVAAEQSTASRKFCQQVYGRDLCQFNSMSMMQLEKLLEVMNLSEKDHLLDMGCGVGLISEYISDITRASLLGIDLAPGAIRSAQERTLKKRERLSYQVMDMDELSLPEKAFSGVISIDAIHFAHDLKRTILAAWGSLRENGQMGIFYAHTLSAGEPAGNLDPGRTPFAKVVLECGLDFRTWDFTQDELAVWERILEAAEGLKDAFEGEGKLELYEMSVADALPMLEAVKTGKRRRYLYHIR